VNLIAWLAASFVTGLFIGPLLVLIVAPFWDGAAKWLVKKGIRAGGDWILKPVGGTQYDLEPVDYEDAEGKAWRHGDDDDDERQYYDDHGGRMRTLFGRSFGLLADEDISAIVDSVDCTIGKAEAEKATDGGELKDDAQAVLEDLQDRAHIGTTEKRNTTGESTVIQRIDYINPFVELDGELDRGVVVDVRDAVSVLSQNGSPETPRKTAENAAAAERAFEDWGELKRNASLIAAFMMGAIVTEFVAGSGGGGGGGGVSMPIIAHGGRMLLDLSAMALGVA